MARPPKFCTEYRPKMPHDPKERLVFRKFGWVGKSVYNTLLDLLTITDFHYLKDGSPEVDLEIKCELNDPKFFVELIDYLARIGAVHAELWHDYSIIFSEILTSQLEYVYAKRSTNRNVNSQDFLRNLKHVCDTNNEFTERKLNLRLINEVLRDVNTRTELNRTEGKGTERREGTEARKISKEISPKLLIEEKNLKGFSKEFNSSKTEILRLANKYMVMSPVKNFQFTSENQVKKHFRAFLESKLAQNAG